MGEFSDGLYFMDAYDVEQTTWHTVRSIARLAFTEAMPHRDQRDIDKLVHWNDDRYYYIMGNPNKSVGDIYKPNLQFWGSTLVLAVDKLMNKAVGYMTYAEVTSGSSSIERKIKHKLNCCNYVCIGQIAVLPEEQGRGVATKMVESSLSQLNPRSPVVTHIWPDESPGIKEALINHCFETTHITYVRPYGENTPIVDEYRMQAPSVKHVLGTMGNC